MIVMKFGGTSFSNLAAWQRVLAIAQSRITRSPVIVVSAIWGVTDALATCAENAAAGKRWEVQKTFESIASTHFDACEYLKLGKGIRQQLGEKMRELRLCLESVSNLKELTTRTRDQILAYGELLTVILLPAFLQKNGVNALAVDSRDCLITNDKFSSAIPLHLLSGKRTRSNVFPLLRNGRIPVLPGFIGSTQDGYTSTIGRGGSDYSASLFAGWLKAEELEIWKDVPGFMTADPRVVPEAETIPVLSYDEAEQLCRYGAKILHPQAVRFAARKKISIRVLFTANPDQPGTLISNDPALRSPQSLAVAAQKHSGRVIVVGDGLKDPSVTAQILGSCAGLEILRISQDVQRSRLIVITASGEDTDRAVRQIHAGVKASLNA